MPLTDKAILDAKPAAKARRLADGGGLYIEVAPSGRKHWRLKYLFNEEEHQLDLGSYPRTSLKLAREKRHTARALLASGIDPNQRPKTHKVARDPLRSKLSTPVQGPNSAGRLAPSVGLRPLELLGIDTLEEDAYRALLSQGMATAKELAPILALSPRRAQKMLDNIESKGLASHSPERPRRYIAVPPEIAIEALVGQHQVVLERARSTIPDLKRHAVGSANAKCQERAVEVITSYPALGQILMQLRQTVQKEVFGFQRAPWLYRSDVNRPAMRPGVRVRTVSDSGYLALPGAMNSLRSAVESGEEARTFPTLPIKMFVVDRRIALIPLNVEDQGGPTLLVRAPALLDALYELFEMTWVRATPLKFARSGSMEVGTPDTQASEAAAQMIPLLAAGLNDKAIVYETGISIATLNRRVAELMKCFDTRTRFQLGWRAALDAFPERLESHGRRRP